MRMLCMGRSKRRSRAGTAPHSSMLSDNRPGCTYSGTDIPAISNTEIPNAEVFSPAKRSRLCQEQRTSRGAVLARRNHLYAEIGPKSSPQPPPPPRRAESQESEEKENHDTNSADLPISLGSHRDHALRCRGHLRLSIDIMPDMLTVHVLQARRLSCGSQTQCNSYTQVSLMPDGVDSTHFKTKVVYDSNHPQFDEKVSINLLKTDQRRRLVISLWHKSSKTGCVESLGCMSFSVQRLLTNSQSVSGWYYLLCEKLGPRKHVRVPTTSSNTGGSWHIPKIHTNLAVLQPHDMCIHHGATGFGFTISGSCPTRVGTLVAGGAASLAGLLQGDFIAVVNGCNVSRSAQHSVAKIVRLCEESLVIRVHRSSAPSSFGHTTEHTEGQRSACHSSHLETCQRMVLGSSNKGSVEEISRRDVSKDVSCKEMSYTMDCKDTRTDFSLKNSTMRDSGRESSLKDCIEGSSQKHSYRKRDKLCRSSTQASCSSTEQTRWDPFMSPISRLDASSRFIESTNLDQSFIHTTGTTSVGTLRKNSAFSDLLAPNLTGEIPGDASVMLPWPPDCSLTTGHSFSSIEGDMIEADEVQLCPSPATVSSVEGDSERDLVAAVCDVLRCEQAFAQSMQRGMQAYSRPLRHRIISAKQHAALFRNIEKLVMISLYHISQLSASSYCQAEITSTNTSLANQHQQMTTNNIGAIYKPKLAMLCSAYASYDTGMCRALTMLGRIQHSTQFCLFLNNASLKADLTSIDHFLMKPTEHLEELLSKLQEVMRCSHPEDTGYDDLAQVIGEIHTTCCQDVTFDSTNSGSDLTSLSNFTTHCAPSMASSDRVDSELLQLQNRIAFVKGIQPCQLAVGSRHLIFSGELLWHDSATYRPLYVLLLSDMILLTARTPGCHLVIHDPIYLHDIVHMQFNCIHPCEFWLETRTHRHTLKAVDMEQRSAWKTILEHRTSRYTVQGQLPP